MMQGKSLKKSQKHSANLLISHCNKGSVIAKILEQRKQENAALFLQQ
ncbi:hypothetical protein [Methylophaga nitratireducenticrescens]|uniref:Uncharacterized protein n=1 Tax=Methylophaga nitratireducenticrescens TaxID=754476 RepID=I1XN54_METNJ